MAVDPPHAELVKPPKRRRFRRVSDTVTVADEVAERLAQRFAALGDPNRVKIIEHLRQTGEQSVQDVARALDLPHPNVSRHLNVMFTASVVVRRKEGNRSIYSLDAPALLELLDRLHAEIEEEAMRLAASVPLASLPGQP
jgi:ArsR family transcriptional regulator